MIQRPVGILAIGRLILYRHQECHLFFNTAQHFTIQQMSADNQPPVGAHAEPVSRRCAGDCGPARAVSPACVGGPSVSHAPPSRERWHSTAPSLQRHDEPTPPQSAPSDPREPAPRCAPSRAGASLQRPVAARRPTPPGSPAQPPTPPPAPAPRGTGSAGLHASAADDAALAGASARPASPPLAAAPDTARPGSLARPTASAAPTAGRCLPQADAGPSTTDKTESPGHRHRRVRPPLCRGSARAVRRHRSLRILLSGSLCPSGTPLRRRSVRSGHLTTPLHWMT